MTQLMTQPKCLNNHRRQVRAKGLRPKAVVKCIVVKAASDAAFTTIFI